MNIGPKIRVVTAGESIDNLFSGELNEFITEASMVYVAMNGDSTNGNDLVFSFNGGRESVVQNARCTQNSRIPVWPDDFLVQDAVLPGDRLTMQVRNTDSVNSVTLYYAVVIEPVA